MPQTVLFTSRNVYIAVRLSKIFKIYGDKVQVGDYLEAKWRGDLLAEK